MGGVRRFRIRPLRPREFARQGAHRISRRIFGAAIARAFDAGRRSSKPSEQDRRDVVELLAAQLVAQFGAPDLAIARLAAEEETGFAASLCDHPPGVLIAVTRSHDSAGIREVFRTLRPREGAGHSHAFEFLESVGDDDLPAEHLDLAGLGKAACQ